MKISATEFARLTELLAKGSALTDEEKTEKAAIESKIVAEEDGETGGAGDEQPPPTGDESDQTDDTDDSDDSDQTESDPEETPDADLVDDEKAFGRLSIGDKFRALTASRAGLLTKLNAANARITSQGEQLAAATARADQAEAALATAQADLATARERVTTLEAAASDLNKAVTDELAGVGLDRKELVAGDSTGKGGALEAAYEDFQSAKTPEAKAAAHKRIKALQAKKKGAAAASLN